MRFAIAFTLAVFSAAPALANGCFGPGDPLFHCPTTKGKQVDLCRQGSTVYYRFGPANGPAEMILTRHISELDLTPWPGAGGTFWEEVTLTNGSFSYLLYHSAERKPGGLRQGGVVVQKDGQEIARVECAPNTIEADYIGLFEAKDALGQK